MIKPRALGLVAALAPACAAVQSQAILRAPEGLPERARVIGVPFIAESQRDCAAATLGMALAWSGSEVPLAALTEQVYTPAQEGALRSDVVAAARRHRRLAVPVQGLRGVLMELAVGHPVIVFQNLGLAALPRWHYALAVGYDLGEERIELHSGDRAFLPVALANFERTWARGDFWALLVLPPGQMPASAGELELARAAAALERVGHWVEALATYEALQARFPQSFAARVGLGNARHGLGDPVGAAQALREALAIEPLAAAVWNNLAVVLAALGDREGALVAARRAVALAGPDERAVCERTLAEVAR